MSLGAAGVTLIDCDHRTPPAAPVGYPYVTIPQLKAGRLNLSEARRISAEHFKQWTRKADPQPFDVVLSRRCNPGETAFVPLDAQFALGQNLVLLRTDGATILPEFLRWLVRGPIWWEQVQKFLNVGAVFDSLRCSDVPKFELMIPPIVEQRSISRVLGTLDDKIELNRKMSETLEELARTLFKSWFVDFDPVHARAAGKKPFGMDDATAALFPDSFEDSKLGPIPRGWRVATLGDVISELEVGKRPKGGVKGIEHGVPSIGAESIKRVGEFDFSKTKYVPVEFFEAMGRGYVQSRDVLLYKDGGRPGEFEPHVSMFGDGFPFERCCINEHVYRIRANEHYSQNLLYFALSSDGTMHEMRMKGGGVAVPGLNSTAARSLLMTVPPPAIVRAFDEVVEPMIARILLCSKESRTLAELRDTLLPKLLSGELRVPLDVADAPATKAEQLGLFGDR